MPESSSASFLADVTRCFKHLEPTDEATRNAIADMLGLHEEETFAPRRMMLPITRPVQKDRSEAQSNQREREKPAPPSPAEPDSAQTSTWIPSTLELLSKKRKIGTLKLPPYQCKPVHPNFLNFYWSLFLSPNGQEEFSAPPFRPQVRMGH